MFGLDPSTQYSFAEAVAECFNLSSIFTTVHKVAALGRRSRAMRSKVLDLPLDYMPSATTLQQIGGSSSFKSC